ncbi:hypothetical protein ACFQPG_05405 [Sphingomonas sp. GCM10030256]|uniref:hypothetical protein n=1 Tax=Sphingomonas sp. GCM10030256 TaxID=3273427 RepID=UPI00360D7F20
MTVAYPTTFQPVRTASPVNVLVVANTDAAVSRARRTIEGGGHHGGRPMSIAEAGERLDTAAQTGLIWIEIEELDSQAEQLLQRVDAEVGSGRYGAVVAAPPELIDPVTAWILHPDVELVIGRNEIDRAAALSLATLRAPNTAVRDSNADEGAARLRQLSEEVSRIASTLARLSGEAGPASPASVLQAPATAELPAVPGDAVRSIIRARRARGNYLPADLFADPAWDMLLDLL